MRYLKIIKARMKFWFLRILEFRVEVIMWSVNSVIWAVLSLVAVELIYGKVTTIAGWAKPEAMLVAATQAMFNGIMWWWILPSLLSLSEMIRDGKLDGYLLSPMNSQFSVSFMKFEFDNYPRVIVLAIILGKIIHDYSINIVWWNMVGYLVMLVLGVIIFYGLFLILTTLTFWLVRIFNLEELFETVMSQAKYPSFIFTGPLKAIFFWIIPTVFIATYPVTILLGRGSWLTVLGAILMAILFMVVSSIWWKFALKRYSGAGGV